VLNFIHLSATGVAEIAKSTTLKGCPHNFLYIVFIHIIIISLIIITNKPTTPMTEMCALDDACSEMTHAQRLKSIMMLWVSSRTHALKDAQQWDDFE
jgi:hypothetical protein